MKDINSIYQQLLQPSDDLVAAVAALDGDILLLGVGGKMGPSLAKLAKQAIDKSGTSKKIIGVSRFSEYGLRDQLEKAGIETCKADLLKDDQLKSLPDIRNVIYLAGTKFGTSGNESFTWAMNSYLPGRVAEKYKDSRIVVFSTGNVYHLTPVDAGGATEDHPPNPVGEYAQSCLGRERVFEYFSSLHKTPMLIYRLNYANDVSYGVLLDIAMAVEGNKPIDLSMGHVNVIWQGDANAMAILSLEQAATPAKILNLAGPEVLRIRDVAEEFGKLLGKAVKFSGVEASDALLSNAQEAYRLFGQPRVEAKQVMRWVADWVKRGGETLDKPTHFEARDGKF